MDVLAYDPFVSEDRKGEGIIPELSVRENLTLAALPMLSRLGIVDLGSSAVAAASSVEVVRLEVERRTVDRIAGALAAIGGLLVAYVGVGWCFVVNLVALSVATTLFVAMRPYPHAGETTPPSLQGIREGISYAVRRRDLLGTYLVDIAAMLMAMPVVLFPALAEDIFARPELLFRVSHNVFFPKPDVTSAVVRLGFGGDEEKTAGVDPSLLREVVRTAFNQRRKTLHNSLGAWTRGRGIELPEAWAGRRAEELDPPTFVALARYLEDRLRP